MPAIIFCRIVAGLALLSATLPGSAAIAAVAEYRVTFDATWSPATHPAAYPSGAHFSGMVGGTHDDNVMFWMLGGLATEGIERMAESGLSAPLLSEVGEAISAGTAYSTISASGGPSPGSRQATFFVSSTHMRATIVAMVAPSPDWFIGVNGLALRMNGAWLDDVVISLPAVDAGTDDGIDFTSPNQDANPAQPIATFAGTPFAGTPDLGTFTFELLNVVTACNDGVDNDGDTLVDLQDPGCETMDDDTETSPLLVCDDGLDNDGDGSTDAQDPGCASVLDVSELSDVECDDGLDNDGDSQIDYPDDPDCFNSADTSESNDVPSLPPLALGLWAITLALSGGLLLWPTETHDREKG